LQIEDRFLSHILWPAIASFFLSIAAYANGAESFRIVVTRSVENAPLYMAQTDGSFSAAGLDARLVVNSDAAVASVVADGKADAGIAPLSASFFNEASGGDLAIIASGALEATGFPSLVALVSRRAFAGGFRSLRDLPHRRIAALSAASSADYALTQVAAKYRLDIQDMTLATYATAQLAGYALAEGLADAVMMPYADALQLQESTIGGVVLPLSDYFEWQDSVVVVPTRTIATQRPEIQKFIRAYKSALAEYDVAFLQRDDEATPIFGPRYDADLDLISRDSQTSEETLRRTLPAFDRLGRLDVADIARQFTFWRARGAVRSDAHAPIVDTSFVGTVAR
jgi:NitT/TauT family transport system substrate-binding protein